MYMLKLRHGDSFATRSGSAWRLIFVLALMPWLRRYRLDDSAKDEDGGEDPTRGEQLEKVEQPLEDNLASSTMYLGSKFKSKDEEILFLRAQNARLRDRLWGALGDDNSQSMLA